MEVFIVSFNDLFFYQAQLSISFNLRRVSSLTEIHWNYVNSVAVAVTLGFWGFRFSFSLNLTGMFQKTYYLMHFT